MEAMLDVTIRPSRTFESLKDIRKFEVRTFESLKIDPLFRLDEMKVTCRKCDRGARKWRGDLC